MQYTLSKIAEIVKGKIIGNENVNISFLIFDSRMIVPSQGSLFFAIKGSTQDGHNFINEVYEKGCHNFVVSKEFDINNDLKDAHYIIVENTLNALQKLANYHRSLFDIPVFGITGSNGKTIVKEWLTFFLNQKQKAVQSPKSYNSQIGVPLSVWELNENHNVAVFEAGISRPNEMQKLAKIIKPTIGIFTNIGDAHQENFKNISQKINEKLDLFNTANTIIFSADYQYINDFIKNKYPKKKFFTWSKKYDANLKVLEIKKNRKQTKITVIYKQKKYQITLNFSDDASIDNALTVLSALLVFYPQKTPADFDFTKLLPVEMRLQQIAGKNSCTIINDSYNCDLASLRIALDVVNTQNQNQNKTIILSDIFEVGRKEDELYEVVAKMLKNNNITKIIGVGETISKNQDKFSCKKFFFENTDELIENISQLDFHNETILLKGARKYRFEKISEILQLKNHRTVLEINMTAFEHNLDYFRKLMKPNTKLMIMVKAFSYGSGSFEIANFLQRQKVDYLAVAIADEGVELRKAGIKIPILILNPDVANFELLPEFSLEPEIYNFKILDDFYSFIKNKVHNPYPVHIKLDTGMNRLGFKKTEINKLIKKLKEYDKIYIKSVFSHLVGSGEKKFDNFTMKQISDFQDITNFIEKETNSKFLRHILNSSGIERFSNYQFDMVRLGIGLYGISSINNKKLQNISTLKTKIISITEVKKGESVGYSRAWIAKHNSRIATLPIGYADGLNRLLSNGIGKVIINNQQAKIVGNICMDLTMIDITNIDAEIGDEVIIFGKELTISELAKTLNTIPYEILTSVSHRVKRIYVWE